MIVTQKSGVEEKMKVKKIQKRKNTSEKIKNNIVSFFHSFLVSFLRRIFNFVKVHLIYLIFMVLPSLQSFVIPHLSRFLIPKSYM
jgi:hypothetical protein